METVMYKIGVVGDSASVMGFMAVGFTVVTADMPEQASKAITRLASEDYAIIYVTEEYARRCSETIAKYRAAPLPAVIVIPGKNGTDGYGLDAVKESVERAIGADILFKN